MVLKPWEPEAWVKVRVQKGGVRAWKGKSRALEFSLATVLQKYYCVLNMCLLSWWNSVGITIPEQPNERFKDFNNSRLLPTILAILKQVVISKIKHKPCFSKKNNEIRHYLQFYFSDWWIWLKLRWNEILEDS